MHRILVGGSSGAGKTTLARALARRLDLPYVEIDSLFHGAGWVPRPEFEADVEAFTAQPRWVVDHDYAGVRHLVWPRIDTFVWLDYSRLVCEWRVIRRSVPRAVLRRELWNGNRETVRDMLFSPDHPLRWSWTHHAHRRAGFAERVTAADNAHITTVRLPTPAATRRWLATLPDHSRVGRAGLGRA